ncbi:TonB-dependent receptor [Chitinispirillum alkaliphilum]|nr:TonB-dependent receptor [Chitinispirillum alkaliphilum]
MTIISEDQINKSGARHLGELLEIYVPSFQYMYNKWNGDIWAMRGVAADFNNKIIFLVNGVKMNLQGRNGAATEMNLGLMGDIKRIEVLEGPAGMVYGSGAIAGVVNVVTAVESEFNEGNFLVYGSHTGFGLEAMSHTVYDEDVSLTLSGGYRFSSGTGEGATRQFGVLSWPDNSSFINKDGWPGKGSFGSTDGNYRLGANARIGNFEILGRATRQQYSTSSMFGRFPWDSHTQQYKNTLENWQQYLDQFLTEDPSLGNITDPAIQLSMLEQYNEEASVHNSKYFPDVTIDGTTYRYSDFLDDQKRALEFGSHERNWNQTRRFLYDNLSLELKYSQPIFDYSNFEIKLGAIANQQKSFFQNTGFNEERDAWTVGYDYPNLEYETFGERRYYGQGILSLSYSDIQSVFGVEYRIDDIGNDFSGLNAQFGSAGKPVISPVVYHNFALFSENFWDISHDWSLMGGVRLDKHTRTDFVLSPKLAAIFKPSPDHVVKLFGQMSSNNGSANAYEFNGDHYNFDGTVRASEFRDFGDGLSPIPNPAIVVVPTQDDLQSLQPERSMSVELNTMHSFFDDYVQVSPSISYNMMRDNFFWSRTLQRNVNIGDYNALVANLSLRYQGNRFSFGMHNTMQRPVNTNNDYETELEVPTVEKTDQVNSIGDTLYALDSTQTRTIHEKLIRESVTYDGRYFLNVAAYTTKMFADYYVTDWLNISTNARVFFGHPGRRDVSQIALSDNPDMRNAEREAEYLGLYGENGWLNSIAVKWNAGFHFLLPRDLTMSVFANNILGNSGNRHAARWQNSVYNLEQRNFYTTDLRSYELRLSKEF